MQKFEYRIFTSHVKFPVIITVLSTSDIALYMTGNLYAKIQYGK